MANNRFCFCKRGIETTIIRKSISFRFNPFFKRGCGVRGGAPGPFLERVGWMEEILTVYDEQLRPLGAESRERVHRLGLLHKVVQCWVASPRPDGLWLWYQKRARDKASFPGYFDIASTGHVPAGEEPLTAVLREVQEEIGLNLGPEQLTYLGRWRGAMDYGGFRDREIAEAYLYLDPCPAFVLGPEVEEMIRVPLAEAVKKELKRAERIRAVGEKGEFWAESGRFCPYWGEFEAVLLPALAERGFCG